MQSAAQPQADQDATAPGLSRPTIARKCLIAGAVIAPSVIPVAGAGDRLIGWLRRRKSAALAGDSIPAL